MVHEVMILDHSGPELAALQLGAAIKFLTGAAIVATLLEPAGAGRRARSSRRRNIALCARRRGRRSGTSSR